MIPQRNVVVLHVEGHVKIILLLLLLDMSSARLNLLKSVLEIIFVSVLRFLHRRFHVERLTVLGFGLSGRFVVG